MSEGKKMKRFLMMLGTVLSVAFLCACSTNGEINTQSQSENEISDAEEVEESTENEERKCYLDIKDATHATFVITGLTLSPEVFDDITVQNSAVYQGVLFADRYGIQFSYEPNMEKSFYAMVFDSQDADGIMEEPVMLEAGFGENIIVIDAVLPEDSSVDFRDLDGMEYQESFWIDGSVTKNIFQTWFEINENSTVFPKEYTAYQTQNAQNEQAQNELTEKNKNADLFLQDLYNRGVTKDSGNNDEKMVPLTDDYMVYMLRNDEGNPDMEYRESIHVLSFDETGDLVSHVTRILDQPKTGEPTVCTFSYKRFLSLQDYKETPLFSDKLVAYQDYLRFTKGLDTRIVFDQASVSKDVFLSKQELTQDKFMFLNTTYKPEDFPQIAESQVPLATNDFVIFTSKTESGTNKTDLYFFDESLLSISMATIYEYSTPEQAISKKQENMEFESAYDVYETNGRYLYMTKQEANMINKYPVLYEGTYTIPRLNKKQISEYLNSNIN